MLCPPPCGGVLYVADTRAISDGMTVLRLRICAKCGVRYTTEERRNGTTLRRSVGSKAR